MAGGSKQLSRSAVSGRTISSARNLLVSFDSRWDHQISNLNFDLRGNKMKLRGVYPIHTAMMSDVRLSMRLEGKMLLLVTTMAPTCHPHIM